MFTIISMLLTGCLYFSFHMKSLIIKGRILVVANSYHFHVGGIAWRLSRFTALKEMQIERFYTSILRMQKPWRNSSSMLMALLEECLNWEVEQICIYKDLKEVFLRMQKFCKVSHMQLLTCRIFEFKWIL